MKKNKLNWIGVLILVIIYALFYVITTYFLNQRNLHKNVTPPEEKIAEENNNYEKETQIIKNLYSDIKILYDVVNNKFKVNQEDTIVIGDIIYKKITNFDEVMGSVFTKNGIDKYVEDLSNYFAYTDEGYYLAGNLVTYQTYYFRGDETNIFITDSKDNEINGIIYERWTSNNKNTLALVKVIYQDDLWLIDNIDILATE